MTWLLLATAGQFLNAVVALLDKFIVSDEKMLPRPFVYAFYTCLLTGSWVLVYILGFLPLPSSFNVPTYENVEHPTLIVTALAFLAAYTFFMAIVSMYDALKRASASEVMPAIGAIAALASFGLNYYFLDGGLSNNFIAGVLLLSLGTFMLSRLRFDYQIALVTLHSGLFFALHFITMKGLFMETNFDNGFFWSRIALVGFALSLLLVPAYLEKIRLQTGTTTKRAGALVLVTKILAGIGSFMLLKATDWGDVTVVQALDGLKFAFIIVLSAVFVKFLPPSAVKQERSVEAFVRTSLYVAIISLGFVLLFYKG